MPLGETPAVAWTREVMRERSGDRALRFRGDIGAGTLAGSSATESSPSASVISCFCFGFWPSSAIAFVEPKPEPGMAATTGEKSTCMRGERAFRNLRSRPYGGVQSPSVTSVAPELTVSVFPAVAVADPDTASVSVSVPVPGGARGEGTAGPAGTAASKLGSPRSRGGGTAGACGARSRSRSRRE
jgi:hypothetical protein